MTDRPQPRWVTLAVSVMVTDDADAANALDHITASFDHSLWEDVLGSSIILEGEELFDNHALRARSDEIELHANQVRWGIDRID